MEQVFAWITGTAVLLFPEASSQGERQVEKGAKFTFVCAAF